MWAVKPGDQVVCVKDDFNPPDRDILVSVGVTFPVIGAVYTVRDIVERAIWAPETVLGLLLEEIPNPTVNHFHNGGYHLCETAFAFEFFRPVRKVVTSTDISIFNKLLTPARTMEPA